MDWHKVGQCHWHLIGQPTVMHSGKHKRAFWGGVVICGKVWACPVCAAKIQARRRAEISSSMAWAYNHRQGLKAVMLTLTIPHKAWHTVADLLERQKAALHHLRNGRPGKTLRDQMGHAGMIRALELTHGANGWHPHTHELHFLADDADAKLFKTKMLALWEAACVKAGLLDPADAKQVRTFRRRAVDVRDRVSRGDYLAKLANAQPEGPDKANTVAQWGADNELASATSKQGRAKGRSIMQLLYAAADGDKKAGALWLEAIDALRGRPWLFWSHGLKEKVGLLAKTDEEVAEEQLDQAQPMATLDREAWGIVRKHRTARAVILDVVEEAVAAGAGPDDVAAAICAWIEGEGERNMARIAPTRENE